MKTLPLVKLSRPTLAALAITLLAACATPPQPAKPCPAKYSFHYSDPTRGFGLCLPAAVKKGDASAYPSGSVLFSGFAVPQGTNLQSKQLIIIPGTDDNLQGASASGQFTAGGVVFQRAKGVEGSAGHSTTHLIYTWTQGAKALHFDFALRAVNVGNYDPADRPAEYNLPAQMKLADEIMSTFQRLP